MNEVDVVAFLERYGFKKISAEKFSHQGRMVISSKAKYLISPHGSGLTKMLFIQKGVYVLELANKSKTVKLLTDYYKIADIIGINYVYQEYEIGEDKKSKNIKFTRRQHSHRPR